MKSDRSANADTSARVRALRYGVRAPALLGLILIAVPLGVVVSLLPDGTHDPLREPLSQRIVRLWSQALLRGVFGFRIRRHGAPVRGPVLFVANHVSWMDIQLLHTQRAACFVAKAEIARWPLIGWLATCAGTIFHQRGHAASLNSVMAVMVQRLREARPVAVFPEGGIEHAAEGIARVRTFHARVFQCALDAQVPIQPVALTYRRGNDLYDDASFRPGETFLGNFLRLLGSAPITAEVHFLSPLTIPAESGRRAFAEAARAAIATCLEQRP